MNKLDHALLLTIMHHEPDAYGVPIRREVSQRLGRDMSLGAIYAALERLEEKGLVASWEGAAAPERGGHAKRLWGVLPAGQKALVEHTRAALNKPDKLLPKGWFDRLTLLVLGVVLALCGIALVHRALGAEPPQQPYSCRLLDEEQRKCAFGSCDPRVTERLNRECWQAGGRGFEVRKPK